MAPSHRSSLSVSSKGDLHPEELFLHDGKKYLPLSSPRNPANDRVVGARVIYLSIKR